jgi:hypothetical protein
VRHLSRTILLAAAVALCAAPAAARPERHGHDVQVVPAHVIHGVTGGELLGVDSARDYAGMPTPDCLRLGRRGEILQVGPSDRTTTCTVKSGTPIFVFGFGSACSDIDPEPFFAIGEAAQGRCARENTHESVLEVHVTADGGTPVDIRGDRFEITSPQVTAVIPEDNPFGVPAGTTAHIVSDIYAAAIRSLTPGQHTILVGAETIYGQFDATTIVDVVPGA